MPLPTKGSNASSAIDYEQLTYDANSNVASRRLRDATSIAFTHDNLDRPTLKNLPGTEPDVTYAYDLLGRLTSAAHTGNTLSFTSDALSRNLTQVGPQGTATSAWDLAGRRTQLTYPGTGLYVNYDYLVTGETTKVRENGAVSGIGVLVTYAYDDLGRRMSLTFGNSAVQAIAFDPVSRLASLSNQLTGTANDLSATFAYNPASQIKSNIRTGDAYAWTGHFNENKTGTPNGLNQLTQYGPKALTHDSKGNVTAFGTKAFTYSSENLLLTGPNATTLSYDPVMRLHQVVAGTTQRFAYDGLDRIAEYNGSNVLQRRYVHGPAMDEPIVWYEGSGTTDRRFLSSDERGSIVSITDSAGAVLGLNRYDEFGQPQSTNLGAFGYTGQAWLPSVGLWYYKARVQDPELGRFLQPDPIGYADSPNLYAYVLNDPINLIDPLGLQDWQWCGGVYANQVCGRRGAPLGGAVVGGSGSFSGVSLKAERHVNDGGICGTVPTGSLLPPPAVAPPTVGVAGGTVIDVLGSLGLRTLGVLGAILSLSRDTRHQSSKVRHYTDQVGYEGITLSGVIRPGASGYSFFTPDHYASASSAQARLALPRTPVGYFGVSGDRAPAIGPATIVPPHGGHPGGGRELRVPVEVRVSTKDWTPIC